MTEERSSWRTENGGSHPKESSAILYMSRKFGGRVLKSVQNEYKNTKIKAAVKLYNNADPTMAAVRSFEELAVQNGRHSIIKDVTKHTDELDVQFCLSFRNPVAFADGKEVEAKKVKQAIYKARQQEIHVTIFQERWQGKLIKNRWDHEKVKLEECFAWVSSCKRVPQRMLSLEYKSFTNNCYLLWFTTAEKQNHKSRKNAVCGGIPWRICSTFHLAAVRWHRLSTYRDIKMLSRSYPWKSLDLQISLLKMNRGSNKSHLSRSMRMGMEPPSGTPHYSLTQPKLNKQVRVIEMSCSWLENRETKEFEKQ